MDDPDPAGNIILQLLLLLILILINAFFAMSEIAAVQNPWEIGRIDADYAAPLLKETFRLENSSTFFV